MRLDSYHPYHIGAERFRKRHDLDELKPAFTEVVLVGLVGYRLTRALATDEIGAPLRDVVRRRAWPTEGVSKATWRWLDALVSCEFCLGWWLTGAVALAARPGLRRWLWLWPAAAGVQSALVLFAKIAEGVDDE